MLKNNKVAVILFNLGGPDKLESVKPFLFNLFNDKAIIGLPQPLRFLLAKLISSRRNKKAQKIYQQIGGKSPLLNITLAQGYSLERELSFYGDYKVFTIMRYWHPFASEVIENIKEYHPRQIILIPLYPQFSSSTTQSSIDDFMKNFDNKENCNIKIVCCYPEDDEFIKSHAILIKKTSEQLSSEELRETRLLFSAHGLPQRTIDNGDPYVFQINKTAHKVIQYLGNMVKKNVEDIDYRICYQSKVGPMQWTSPSLEHEVNKAAIDKKNVIVIPIAFVSDHSETLVELDIEYKEIAYNLGIKKYFRVPSLNVEGHFIKSLADISRAVVENNENTMFSGQKPYRLCPKNFKLCPNKNSCQI